jgi:hypothetical protein
MTYGAACAQMRSMFFTQGSWSYMSGMIDVVLKCSEDGQTDMRLVGLKVQEYTMSTCYFLGQRPEMTLGLVSLSGCRPTGTEEAAAAGSTVNFVTGDGTVVTPFVLVPHEPDQRSLGAGAKRTFEQMAAGDSDGTAVDAAGSASAGGALDPSWESQDALPKRLVLSYSPYHRAKSKLNSRRRADLLALGSRARATAPSVCYSVVLPPLPGKFDVKKAEALGVEGRLRGMLVKGQAVTLPSGEIVKPEQCVSAGTPGGTVLIVDCPTPAHAATLLQKKVFWDLVTPADKAGQLCVVHMSPRQVLSCPDYIAWSKPFPASTATSQPTAAAPPSQPAAGRGAAGDAAGGEKEDGDSTQSAVPDETAQVGSSSTRKRRRREEADAAGAGASKKKKPRSVCPHQRERSKCKECGGASICQHQRRRSRCKECGGASICQHQRERSACKECGGASICQHQRIRRTCKECGGAGLCQHQRERSKCKECGGAGICQHQRQRSKCKDCRVQTTGTAVEDDEAEAFEAGALAVARMHEPPQKRQKTVLTVSASLVSGDADGSAACGTHRTLAPAVGVRNSQLCTAAAAAPLPEGVSEQQRAESPVLAPLLARASVMVHASAEMDSEYFIADGRAQAPQHCLPGDSS